MMRGDEGRLGQGTISGQVLAFSLLLVGAMMLAACSNGGGGGEPRALAPNDIASGSGNEGSGILIARDEGLVIRDGLTGDERLIERSPSGSVVSFPRWSPDGTRIAYVMTRYATRADQQDWGSSVIISDADGSNETVVLTPQAAGMQVEGIAWTPDGTGLYVSTVDRNVLNSLKLDRLDLLTGQRTTIAPGAAYPDVSPDGSRISYLTYSSGFEPGGLWLAKPDGSEKQQVLTTPGVLVGVRLPRFAPDGQSLIFGGVVPADSGQAAPGCTSGRRWPWEPRIAAAHGPPVGIWLLPLEGGTPRRVSDLIEDDPSVMWSPDGTQLAAIGACGFYAIGVADGAVQKVGEGAISSQVDWR